MRSALFVPLIILVCVSPVAAQDLAAACSAVRGLSVGQWAQYRVSGPQMRGEPTEARFAIVRTQQVDGKEHYWYEMKMEAPQGAMIMQFLVPGYPYEQGDIKAAVMKAGDQPAMQVPDQMIGMMQSRSGPSLNKDAARECSDADLVGRETVSVPAGDFDAFHIRSSQRSGTFEAWCPLTFRSG